MSSNQIRKKINNALNDEERTGRLMGTIRTVARQNGANLSQEQVMDVVSFAKDYIQHVPFFIDEALKLSKNTGAEQQIAKMIRELEVYWKEGNDVIPDHLGLLGVLDDAYATMFLLQSVSDYCRSNSGVALLEQDWTKANRSMRNLIGEPAALIIEQKVGITIAQNLMGNVINQILNSGFSINQPDPIWGNTSVDQIVDTQLGAMGVV